MPMMLDLKSVVTWSGGGGVLPVTVTFFLLVNRFYLKVPLLNMTPYLRQNYQKISSKASGLITLKCDTLLGKVLFIIPVIVNIQLGTI